MLRLDVDLAIQNGTRTLFRWDEAPLYPVLCEPDVSSWRSSIAAPWMQPIMRDLFSFSVVLNEAESCQKPKLDPLDYTETLLSLLYRLVEASPPKQNSLYDNGTYLAILAFMTTLLPEYTHDGPGYPLLSDRLGDAVQTLCAAALESSPSGAPLLLWILFISGVTVLNLKGRQWLSPLIADTCERLKLDNWAAIRQRLSQFPWVFALHDAPGHRLWEHVQLGGEISWDSSSRGPS